MLILEAVILIHNILFDLHNSSHYSQPDSIIVNYYTLLLHIYLYIHLTEETSSKKAIQDKHNVETKER